MIIGETNKKILGYAIFGLAVFGLCGCLMQNLSVKDTTESGSEKNESDTDQIENYVHGDGEWIDLSDRRTLEKLGLDFTTNNCCIKAIY